MPVTNTVNGAVVSAVLTDIEALTGAVTTGEKTAWKETELVGSMVTGRVGNPERLKKFPAMLTAVTVTGWVPILVSVMVW